MSELERVRFEVNLGMYPCCGCGPQCEPHCATPSFPGRDLLLQIISFPSTEGFATILSGWNPYGEVKGGDGRLRTLYTVIISCVMYRKMESVEYSGAQEPWLWSQQLSSISAAAEPPLSSYYVWYITMRWCDLTWQPMWRLSDLAEMYETGTKITQKLKWGQRTELQYLQWLYCMILHLWMKTKSSIGV